MEKDKILNNLFSWKKTENELLKGINNNNYSQIINTSSYIEQAKQWSEKADLYVDFQNFMIMQFGLDNNQNAVTYFGGLLPNGRIINQAVDLNTGGTLNNIFNKNLSNVVNFNNHAVWYTANSLNVEGKRTQNNVAFAKTFFVDFDLIKAGISIEDGIEKIIDTIEKHHLPIFDSLIYTGHGLQSLWHFKENSDIDKVMKINIGIASIFDDLGIDFKVSKDSARYLRMPYTFNIKKEYDKPSISAVIYTNTKESLLTQKTEDVFKPFEQNIDLNNVDIHHFKSKKTIHFPTETVEMPQLQQRFENNKEIEQFLNKVRENLPNDCTVAFSQEEGEENAIFYANNLDLFKHYNQGMDLYTRNPEEIKAGLKVTSYSLNSLFEILEVQKRIAKGYLNGETTFRNNLLSNRIIILSKLPQFRPVFPNRMVLSSNNQNLIETAIEHCNQANKKRFDEIFAEISSFNRRELKHLALSDAEVSSLFESRDLFYYAKYTNIGRTTLADSENEDVSYYQSIIDRQERIYKESQKGNVDFINQQEIQKQSNDENIFDKRNKDIQDNVIPQNQENNQNNSQSVFPPLPNNESDIEEFEDNVCIDDGVVIDDDSFDDGNGYCDIQQDNQSETTQNNYNDTNTQKSAYKELNLSNEEIIENIVIAVKKGGIISEEDNQDLKDVYSQYSDYILELVSIRQLLIEYNLLEDFQSMMKADNFEDYLELIVSKLKTKILEEKIKMKR